MADDPGAHEHRLSDELRQDLFGRTSFVPVFLLALMCVMSFPLADSFRWGFFFTGIVLACTIILAFHRSQVRKHFLRIATAIVVVSVGVSLLTATVLAAHGEQTRLLNATTSGITAALILLAQPAIVRQTFRHKTVTINTLAAGITAYLFIGLFFTSLFRFIEAIQGVPFFVQHPNAGPGEYQYFSFVTLTTLGYGDYTAATDVGQSAAVMEAVLGQVFLVTAVARIVSLMGQEKRFLGPSSPDGDDVVDPRRPDDPD